MRKTVNMTIEQVKSELSYTNKCIDGLIKVYELHPELVNKKIENDLEILLSNKTVYKNILKKYVK